jgi:hypothetical protein
MNWYFSVSNRTSVQTRPQKFLGVFEVFFFLLHKYRAKTIANSGLLRVFANSILITCATVTKPSGTVTPIANRKLGVIPTIVIQRGNGENLWNKEASMEWLINNFEMLAVLVAGGVILAGFFVKTDAASAVADAVVDDPSNFSVRTSSGMDTSMFAVDWEGGSKHGGMKIGPE